MTIYNDHYSDHISNLFAAPDAQLEAIYAGIPAKGLPAITIQPEEGQFLQMLTRLSGGHRALEIGTLGGYSGTWIARGLVPGGQLITLELEPRHAQVAKEHFELAGVADRVEIRLGNALEALRQMDNDPPFDFIFIDADKTSYPEYFAWAIAHTRVGGAIAIHNMFRGGSLLNNPTDSGSTMILELQKQAASDSRLLATIYPAGDGTLVAVKTSP